MGFSHLYVVETRRQKQLCYEKRMKTIYEIKKRKERKSEKFVLKGYYEGG